MRPKLTGPSSKALIEEGRFGEAQQMDIDDVQSKFGPKYDVHVGAQGKT